MVTQLEREGLEARLQIRPPRAKARTLRRHRPPGWCRARQATDDLENRTLVASGELLRDTFRVRRLGQPDQTVPNDPRTALANALDRL